jgi:GrpB-like predicted nucleotidyltransferase (UPF0157 family)
MPDPVIIVSYDPRWPPMYEEEKALIVGAMGRWLAAIEHIGSTSVPGLGAKPIIDIMVGVRSLDDAQYCIEPLAAVGYVYKPQYEQEMPERRYFNKGPQDNHRHLHMVELGGEFWQRQLLFRNYLRAHPEAAQAYEALKRDLAAHYGQDREGYTEAKTEFIRSIGEKAQAEMKPQRHGDH